VLPVVELEQVTKVYRQGTTELRVLAGIDLAIAPGELVGIVGASGSGKSTLMNILGCLDRPTSGRYRLDGQDVSALDDDQLSALRNRHIGFVFQSFQLISQLDVLENVEVPLFYGHVRRRERRALCRRTLDAVGLGGRLRHFPAQLSGGECQRVAIARALVGEPALLLTDEPTGNLDSRNGAEVLRILRELNEEGRTIVIVTHNMEIAATLPRVLEMSDGELAPVAPRAGGQGA